MKDLMVFATHDAVQIVQFSVGLIFAYAAVSKLLSFSSFLRGMRAYEMVPEKYSGAAAGIVVVGELTIAISHLSNLGRGFIISGTVFVLILFSIVTARELNSEERRPCMCFGGSQDDAVSASSFLRVLVLLLLELVLFFTMVYNETTAERFSRDAFGIVLKMLIAATFVCLMAWCLNISRIRDIWVNSRKSSCTAN